MTQQDIREMNTETLKLHNEKHRTQDFLTSCFSVESATMRRYRERRAQEKREQDNSK